MLAVFHIVIIFLLFPQQVELHNMSVLGMVAHASNLALRRQRQEDQHKFKASLVYIAKLRESGLQTKTLFQKTKTSQTLYFITG